MNIAIALNKKNLDAVIPDRLEDAAGILILETDTLEIIDYVTDQWVEVMVKYDCEVLICGAMYDPQLFEEVANACITRYLGAGFCAKEATEKMLLDQLELIRDYVGGTGCGAHGDPANCAEHDHN